MNWYGWAHREKPEPLPGFPGSEMVECGVHGTRPMTVRCAGTSGIKDWQIEIRENEHYTANNRQTAYNSQDNEHDST